MLALRWAYLLASFGCLMAVLTLGRWQGVLYAPQQRYLLELARTPVWAPPACPTYTDFHEVFGRSAAFPLASSPGLFIDRRLKADWMALDLLLYCWCVNSVAGAMYVGARAGKRDIVLHLAVWMAIGQTVAAALCTALWTVFGGWGPPLPLQFGIAGLLGGIILGVKRFERQRVASANALRSGR